MKMPMNARVRALFSVTLVALASVPVPSSADCMPATLQAFLVTPAADVIPSNGALLVGLRQHYDTGVRTAGPDFPVLTLRRGARTIALRAEAIAPMLARYVPATAPAAGEYELVGLGVSVRFGPASTSPPRLPAPSTRAVQRRAVPERYGSMSLALRVVLASAPPPGAVALIVRGPGGTFGQAALTGGQLELTIFTNGDCEQTPRGRIDPPLVGERVQVCFVNARGEVGAPQTLRVTQG